VPEPRGARLRLVDVRLRDVRRQGGEPLRLPLRGGARPLRRLDLGARRDGLPPGGREARLRLGELRLGIGAVEPDEEIALAHALALAHADLEDPRAHARREVHRRPLDLPRPAGRGGEDARLPPEPQRDERGEDDHEHGEDDHDSAHRLSLPSPRRAGPPP
jgi:hypothetical protein